MHSIMEMVINIRRLKENYKLSLLLIKMKIQKLKNS